MIIECGGHKWYPAKGVIKYNLDGSVFVHADNSIVEYYQAVVKMHLHLKLNTPLSGAHITVISSKWENSVKHSTYWKKRESEEIIFYYTSTIFRSQSYFWLTVHSHDLINLRTELGLGERYHPLHLTIGNTKFSK